MDALPHPASFALGASLVLAGFLSGAALGLGFLREGFLGGYGAPRRRLLRLGHVALVALGILNLCLGLAPLPAPGTGAAAVAAAGLGVGGVTMPLVCALAAWRRPFRHLFAIPVTALVAGVSALWLAAVAAGGTP